MKTSPVIQTAGGSELADEFVLEEASSARVMVSEKIKQAAIDGRK